MTTFQIYLNDDDKEGVHVRVYCNGDMLTEGRAESWESAFDHCIKALENGKSHAKAQERKGGMPSHVRAHIATGREPQL
jgi:hypothetical protein